MNDKFNIQSQKVFKKFNDKLNFKLSYQDYQKILLLMKKEDLSNIVNYIHNYINNQDNYIFFIQMILSYYSDIFLNSNIQNYNFCLKNVKENGYVLQYISNKIKDKYYDINFEAVKQNEVILKYVSKNLLSNKQFIIDCINHNKKCYDYIPEKFKNDTDILKLIENNKNISKENQK